MISNVHKQKYKAYVAATQTVAKTQQIIMLYDGMINFIQQAKEAIRERRIEDRYNLLMKTSAIIHGLQGCLDFEGGGKEIAGVLYSFYSGVDNRLFAIQHDNNLTTCDEVINDLKQMRDAWVAVDSTVLENEAPNIPPSDETKAPADNSGANEANIILSA